MNLRTKLLLSARAPRLCRLAAALPFRAAPHEPDGANAASGKTAPDEAAKLELPQVWTPPD
ncbi:MAG: hypothetical protein KGI41_01510 [Patescibacteria group bacterium]|nr:hypothetical protein [Patescibacteria group bacterium]MDE1965903.1 hypothetical protein [Patescibacteria group bacterium]